MILWKFFVVAKISNILDKFGRQLVMLEILEHLPY